MGAGGSGPGVVNLDDRKVEIKLIKDFEILLRDQDKKCKEENKRVLTAGNENIMDTYLKLVFIKSSFQPDLICTSPKEYFSCMGTDQIKRNAKDLSKNDNVVEYLQQKYAADKTQVKKILQFYQDLGKNE